MARLQWLGRPWGAPLRVWLFNGALALVALVLFVAGVDRVPQGGQTFHLFWPILAAAFAVVSATRVYIHFRRSAQAYSLSEIPLVVGLFFCTPDELVLARVVGAAVGLGIVSRQQPVKLTFNLASFAIEAEAAVLLFDALVPGRAVVWPATWLWVLLIAFIVTTIGFLLSALVISLAEDGGDNRRWRLPAFLGVGGGVANALLGIAIVVTADADTPLTLLLLLPVLSLAAAYSLYTREHEKHIELQQLYESSDLLQRAPEHDSAIADFLRRLSQVFRSEAVRLTLLPTCATAEPLHEITVLEGSVQHARAQLDVDALERFEPILFDERRSFLAVPPRLSPSIDDWLRREGMRNAMATTLHGEGGLLGLLVVGNRVSDVSVFDAQHLTLLETFAAQASAAVQTSRLGDRLAHQAFHDPLTGLANRALLVDRVEHALRRRDSQRRAVSVIFLDLDDFKMVNDTLGHVAGDVVLRAVAQRLQAVLRPSDTAARFGGDEFAVLLDGAEPNDVGAVAERIIGSMAPRFVVGEREVTIRASVGVALTDNADVDAEELLRRADVAMYRAKHRHKGTFEVYEPGMQEGITRRLELRTGLELAIERRELLLHYQPVIDLSSRRPVSAEALVRWAHHRRGMLSPSEFIPIAEESGLIYDIGIYVLEEACRQCHEWKPTLPQTPGFFVSVNVSPRQVSDDRFVGDVRAVLAQTELEPTRLVLEITESVMAEDMQATRQRLQDLKTIGVRVSLDDFGTGYSSLAILQDLPIDFLKIDRAFIEHIADDPRRAALVQAMIRMGRTLGLRLIAEGVELRAQSDRLLALGCRLAQGYYFAPPAPAREVTRHLRGARRAAAPQENRRAG